MRANNVDGERITLRLEQEDLVLLDEYIEKHPDYSSRSHLARIAIRSMIKEDAGAEEAAESTQNIITMKVKIPKLVFEVMNGGLERGEYTSLQSAIEEALRERFLSKEISATKNKEIQESAPKPPYVVKVTD